MPDFKYRATPESSQVQEIGYDPFSKELRVRFHGPSLYAYLDVAPELVAGLLFAESVGKFLNAHIKPGHRCAKLNSASGEVERWVA